MENNENKNSKGLLILVVILSLIVLGLGGWIVYDKVINKEEPKQEENEKEKIDNDKNDITNEYDDGFEKVYIDLSVKNMNYSLYVQEYIDSTKDCEVCDELDIEEIMSGINEKKKYILLDEYNDEKYELKIEDNKAVLYATFYQDEEKFKKKFIFNTINDAIGVFAYEGIGGEDSYPVDFWVIDKNNDIYYVNSSIRYCTNDCGNNIIKIIK